MSPDTTALQRMLQALAQSAPTVLLALGVLVGGLVLTLTARSLIRVLVRRTGLEALAERVGISRALYALGWQTGLARAAADVVLVAGVLTTAAATAEVMGLSFVADGLGVVIALVPRLLTGLALLFAGHLAADTARSLVQNVGAKGRPASDAQFAGSLVYYLLLAVSGALAAEHIGLQTGLVNGLILIFAAVTLGTVGLSFGLGAQGAFTDIVDRHHAERLFPPGTVVTVEGQTGEVLRYGPRSAVIRTPEGQLVVRCGALMTRTLIPRSPGDEPS